MKRGHRAASASAIMGGWNQPQAHVQVISNVVDHGMNIQAGARGAALREADVRRHAT